MFNWLKRKLEHKRRLKRLKSMDSLPTYTQPPAWQPFIDGRMDGFGGEALDLTGVKTTDDDGNEISHFDFMGIAADKVFGPESDPRKLDANWDNRHTIVHNPDGSSERFEMQHVGDRSTKVEYRWVDGNMQQYIDGIATGYPLPPKFWSAEQAEDGTWHWAQPLIRKNSLDD